MLIVREQNAPDDSRSVQPLRGRGGTATPGYLLPSPACVPHLSHASWRMSERRAPSCPLSLRSPRRCDSSSSSSPLKILKVDAAAADGAENLPHRGLTRRAQICASVWNVESCILEERKLVELGFVHVRSDQLCRCEHFGFPRFLKHTTRRFDLDLKVPEELLVAACWKSSAGLKVLPQSFRISHLPFFTSVTKEDINDFIQTKIKCGLKRPSRASMKHSKHDPENSFERTSNSRKRLIVLPPAGQKQDRGSESSRGTLRSSSSEKRRSDRPSNQDKPPNKKLKKSGTWKLEKVFLFRELLDCSAGSGRFGEGFGPVSVSST